MGLTKIDDRGLKTPIDLLDNEKIRLGTGNDLELYHDASHSRIVNGTGNLLLDNSNGADMYLNSGNDIYIRPQGSENGIKVISNGAVELYHNNNKKLETTSGGVTLSGALTANSGDIDIATDGHKIKIGAGDDLQLYHESNESYIVNNTNQLYVRSNQGIYIQPATNENGVVVLPNGAVELYHNNLKKLDTRADGVAIWGPEGGEAQLRLVADEGDDGADYWRLESNASSNNFNLATYASGSWVDKLSMNTDGHLMLGTSTKGNADGDDLTIATSGRTGITIRSASNDYGNIFFSDGTSGASEYVGKVQYYHSDNSMRFATNANDRVIIDSSGRLLVGTDTASSAGEAQYSRIEVSGNTSGATGAGHLTIKKGEAASAMSDGDTVGRLVFASKTGGDFATIQVSVQGSPSGNDFPGTMLFKTCADGASSPAERMRILPSGGITFNGDTAAANALDDYEEGTWSPGVDKNASSMSCSYAYSTGTYTKIGRLVMVWFDFQVNSGGTSGGGAPYITELPFTALYGSGGGNNNGGYGAPTFRDASLTHGDLRIYGNSSYVQNKQIYLQHYNSSGNATQSSLNGSGRITGQAFYFTA